MAASVSSLKEKLQSVDEALEDYRNAARSCGLLPDSENLRLQGHSISDHKRNMAAALARSTVVEVLEKAKNHLLQRVRNLDGKIDELREVSKLNEGTKRNMAGAVGNLTDNLQRVNEAPEGLPIAEHMHKMAAELASFRKNKRKRACVNEAIEHYGLQKAKKHLLQRIQILDEKDEQQEAKKPISQRRWELEEAMGVVEEDEMTELKSFKETMKPISQRRRELEEAMGVLEEKQEDEMTELESFKEAKKPISQRCRELEEAMGVLEEKQEDEMTEFESFKEAKKPILQRHRELEEAMGVLEEKQEVKKPISQRRWELEEAMGVLEEKQGLYISDLKHNMAAPAASLTEIWQCINEALEKGRNHLLQRVQNLDGKIDELGEVSKLNEEEDEMTEFEFESFEEAKKPSSQRLKYLEGLICGLEEKQEDKMTEIESFEEAKKPSPQRLQYLEGLICGPEEKQEDEMTEFESFEEAKEPSSQRLRYLEGLICGLEEKQEDEMTEFESFEAAKKPSSQRLKYLEGLICGLEENQEDDMTEFESFEEAKEPSSQRLLYLEGLICGLEEIQEDEMTEFESLEEAKKPSSQRLRYLEGLICGREEKQEYIVAGKSHGDSFSDQLFGFKE